MHFLSPTHLRLRSKPSGHICLHLEDRKMRLGPPRRALPLTDPDRFILLFTEEGEEVGAVRDLTELEPNSRQVLQDALARAYEITRILRVLDVEREPLSGQIRWRVEVQTSDDEPVEETDTSPERRFRLIKGGPQEPQPTRQGQQREFFLSGAEDVHTARYPRIFLHDVDGNRYEIEDCEALDLESRRVSERYF